MGSKPLFFRSILPICLFLVWCASIAKGPGHNSLITRTWSADQPRVIRIFHVYLQIEVRYASKNILADVETNMPWSQLWEGVKMQAVPEVSRKGRQNGTAG